MAKSKSRVFVAWVAFSAVLVTGCGVSDLISAANKLQAGQIGTLTGNEIRALSEVVAATLNSQDPTLGLTPLTQPQADALAAFFQANNIQTQQDLDNLMADAETNPPAGLVELAAAFDNVDPNIDQQELQLIIQQAFGGGGN